MSADKEKRRAAVFVHEVSYLDKPIYEMQEFPEILAESGWDVTFINLAEGRPFQLPTRKQSVNGRAISAATLRLVRPFQFGVEVLDRVMAIFLLPFELFVAIRTHRPEFVVNYAVPTGGPLINLVCRLLKVPSMQRHIDYSPGLRSKLLSPLVALAEWLTLRTADVISVHNENLRQRSARLAGRRVSEIILLLPPIRKNNPINEPSEENSGVTAVSEFRKNFSNEGLNAVFIGTLFSFSGIRPLVDEWKKVFGVQEETRLHIFGSGKEERWLRARETENRTFGIHFYGFLDFHSINAVLSSGVIGLVPFRVESVSSYALPNKALQYLANGAPTMSTPITGLMRSSFAPGIYFGRDARDLARKLKEFESNPRLLEVLAKEARGLRKAFGYRQASQNLLAAMGTSRLRGARETYFD